MHLILLLNNEVDNPESVGLLLARAYAVTNHKRLVLAVLIILGVCAIALELVCTHVFTSVTGTSDEQPLAQAGAVVNNCDLTNAQIATLIM